MMRQIKQRLTPDTGWISFRHEAQDGWLTVQARCEADQRQASRWMLAGAILRFLAEVARLVVRDRAVFELNRPAEGAIINLNLSTSVRSAGEVVVHTERVVRDPLQNGI